jgi:hypothetical protein
MSILRAPLVRSASTARAVDAFERAVYASHEGARQAGLRDAS